MKLKRCESCDQIAPLISDTGLCGPCCFGEADAIDEGEYETFAPTLDSLVCSHCKRERPICEFRKTHRKPPVCAGCLSDSAVPVLNGVNLSAMQCKCGADLSDGTHIHFNGGVGKCDQCQTVVRVLPAAWESMGVKRIAKAAVEGAA